MFEPQFEIEIYTLHLHKRVAYLSIKKREITMTFKVIQDELPEYMSEMLKPNTDFMKKSFSYRGASAWNDLPNNVVNGYNELSIRSFKTLINNHFNALERS
jgi:hypothetical protein